MCARARVRACVRGRIYMISARASEGKSVPILLSIRCGSWAYQCPPPPAGAPSTLCSPGMCVCVCVCVCVCDFVQPWDVCVCTHHSHTHTYTYTYTHTRTLQALTRRALLEHVQKTAYMRRFHSQQPYIIHTYIVRECLTSYIHTSSDLTPYIHTSLKNAIHHTYTHRQPSHHTYIHR